MGTANRTSDGFEIPAAQSMAAMMSESKPPHLPNTQTGMTLTFPKPTLAMPIVLFVPAPMRPAVCVPCQELPRTAQPFRRPPLLDARP